MSKPNRLFFVIAIAGAFVLPGGFAYAETSAISQSEAAKRQQIRDKYIDETRAINKKRLQEIEERQAATLQKLNEERQKNGMPPFGKPN